MPSTSIPAVLDRHAEEAAFLWLLRNRAVDLPHFRLRELSELDQRVEAHLDALRIAGEEGWKRAWKEFEDHPEPGEAFSAAVLAFEAADPSQMQLLLDAVGTEWKLGRAVASALGWLSADAAELALPLLQNWGTPSARAIGIAGAALRRTTIPAKILEAGLRDPLSRGRTITAMAELGDSSFLSSIQRYITDPDLGTRADAAWAIARLSTDRAAIAELQGIAVADSWYRQRSATLAVRRMDSTAARRWVEMLWQIPGCERVAIQALGALGDPVLIPALLEKLDAPELARLAAEALCLITGLHIGNEKLEADAKEVEAGPNDDPKETRVQLDPDDGLDWPDPAKVRQWWSANRGRFANGSRYLCGKVISAEHCKVVLRDGYQRQRAAAAMELAIYRPREPIFEVRAPGWRQRVA